MSFNKSGFYLFIFDCKAAFCCIGVRARCALLCWWEFGHKGPRLSVAVELSRPFKVAGESAWRSPPSFCLFPWWCSGQMLDAWLPCVLTAPPPEVHLPSVVGHNAPWVAGGRLCCNVRQACVCLENNKISIESHLRCWELAGMCDLNARNASFTFPSSSLNRQ